MWNPKKALEAIVPIRLITWFFGLGIIHYPLNKPRIGLSIFNILITVCVYITSLKYILPVVFYTDSMHGQQIIMFIASYVNMILHLSNIILMWIWRNQGTSIDLRAMRIDEALEKMNVPLDYPSIFASSLKITILWIIVAVSINMMNMAWYYNRYDLLTNFIVVFVLHHPIHASTVNAMNVWMSIHLMKWRFKKINELLLDIVDGENNGQKKNVNRNWPPTPMSINIEDNSRRYISTPQVITNDSLRKAKHIHLELRCMCKDTSQIFGIQIATALASAIFIVAGFIFSFHVIGFNKITNSSWKIHRFFLLTIRVVYDCAKVYIINSCCAEAIKEWEKTGQIIHELRIVSRNNEYHHEICQFSLQIIQNPLSFTACGLVILGYECIRGFIGAVTTHVVILVQTYDPEA